MSIQLRDLPRPRLRVSAGELTHEAGDARRILGIERAGQRLLLGGVMPLWLGAGLADWSIHRRTRIQDTAGARESVIHSLMFAETGVPVLLGLFCEVNAGVLLSAYGAAGVHGGTAYWDQIYAQPRRRVDPLEQHVHSLLEVLPVTAAFLLTALHWDQARALTGRGRPDFGVRFKRRDPLSVPARARLLAAVTVFGILPYAEELWRCWRTKPTVRPLPEPAAPATATLRIPPDGDTPSAGQPRAATATEDS
jgi:hypothetical protein